MIKYKIEWIFSDNNISILYTMAGFTTKTFTKHDDYMTPFSAWDNIKNYIPKDKVIWEAFYGDGKSGTHLQKLGFNVIHEEIDFFENDKGEIVVSNPPFTKIPEVLARLKEMDKPFILIMPSPKLHTQYFRKLFSNTDDPIQIIIPRKRIQFVKIVDGVVDENQKMACNFDCFYYCWKMNLERNIIWLKNEDECDRCGDAVVLHKMIGGENLCWDCWT